MKRPIVFDELLRMSIESINLNEIKSNFILGFSETDFRYYNTPPEIFPFGTTRCDGVHLGHINSCEELLRLDMPVAQVDPSGSGGVLIYGYNSYEFFLNWFSVKISSSYRSNDSNEAEGIRKILGHMMISENRSAFLDVYGKNGNGISYDPIIPDSYWHILQDDNIGVLAPGQSFHCCDKDSFWPKGDPREIAKIRAVEYVNKYPGSSLYYCKYLWWTMTDYDEKISKIMKECYIKLNRPNCANNVAAPVREN